MKLSNCPTSVAETPGWTRRGFLQVTAGVAAGSGTVGLASPGSVAAVPQGIDLESLRETIEDRPQTLVARAVSRGWTVVRDDTVLRRGESWQRELAAALQRDRVELAAIEAVVDFGRVTFGSDREIVRRGVLGRLDSAIRQARMLRCRHLLIVPGLLPEGISTAVIRGRVTSLLVECRDRARRAGMHVVVEQIERGPDHPRLVGKEVTCDA